MMRARGDGARPQPPRTADGSYGTEGARMPVVLGVALGGALGASARYGVDRLIERSLGGLFPWSTFLVNVSGCFLIGVFSAAFVDRHHLPAWLRIGIVMGVIGGYTTVFTLPPEAVRLHQDPPRPGSGGYVRPSGR